MLSASCRLSRQRQFRTARPWNFRPVLEVLEARDVPSFASPVDYNVGTQTSQGLNGFGPQVLTADFNGDGHLDMAVTNTQDGTVSILLGKGDGTFQPAVNYNTGLGANNPVWLAAADFNGDNKLDLAIQGSNGEVAVLIGKGDGSFGSPTTYAVGSGDRGGLAVADFFGDGRQDIAVVDFGASTNEITILHNSGNGTFPSSAHVPMPSSFQALRSIATGNLFGNGYADLAVAGNEGYNNTLQASDPAGVALFRNDGHGNFTYVAQYQAAPTPDPSGGNGQGDTVNPEHVNIADLNNDGKPDIVLSLYDHNIDVFLNQGNGNFAPGIGYTTETPGNVGGYPRGVTFADVNGDGKLDIITDNFGEPKPADQSTPQHGSVGILLGNGDGTFQPATQLTPFNWPSGVAVGDFNGDGLLDIAAAQNWDGRQVAVLLNTTQAPSPPPVGSPGAAFDELGAYRPSNGSWSLDSNSQFGFQTGGPEGQTPLSDRVLLSFSPASPSLIPVSADWTGTGRSKIGDFQAGTWHLDMNDNGILDSNETFTFGVDGDLPVPGNYFGDGIRLAVFRSMPQGYGEFLISDSTWRTDATISVASSFIFGAADDRVVVGDWSGDGITKVGVFRSAAAFGNPNAAVFSLDVANHHTFDSTTKVFIFGTITDGVVIGDWDGSGTSKVGVYRAATAFGAPNTAVFSIDQHGDLDFTKDGNVFLFGLPTDKYVTGRWTYNTNPGAALMPQGGENPTALDAVFANS